MTVRVIRRLSKAPTGGLVTAPQDTGLMTAAAYVFAVAPAGTAACFSIRSMVLLFPGRHSRLSNMANIIPAKDCAATLALASLNRLKMAQETPTKAPPVRQIGWPVLDHPLKPRRPSDPASDTSCTEGGRDHLAELIDHLDRKGDGDG
jgi:hypothetical protein